MIKHLRFYYRIVLLLIILSASVNCLANPVKEQFTDTIRIASPWYKKLAVIGEYQHFITVHHSHFNGGYAFLTYNASDNFSMGLGVAYDYGPLHVDNGYNLRYMKILPVLADFRYVPFSKWIVSPFAVADVGYSTFIKYEQEDPMHIESTRNITDRGLYTFGGFGLLLKLSHRATLYTSTGFTGVHMSFNNEDVNPRGLAYRFGMKVNLH
ncbi:hypothetical protein [Mucilaginibacter xinganensis]|uniref:Outer membrane protein beta-barrel domain-containing protein n=1 Tax=Mucilaginibacter xinganensis TaxID=1234841 RepID=A0A223NRZ1_9SPHI|nr:hypothetical protein [Mucilaginibacter xinganensis]ASU32633.1 hypothetical protein MuYL_0733 [Mucilaginibacter xinganensis]